METKKIVVIIVIKIFSKVSVVNSQFLPFFNTLNWCVFVNNFLKNIEEWIKHIVAILTLVHSTPFGKGKISARFRAWEKSKFLIVIMLSLSDFNKRFDSKITRKLSELKGVFVTL